MTSKKVVECLCADFLLLLTGSWIGSYGIAVSDQTHWSSTCYTEQNLIQTMPYFEGGWFLLEATTRCGA
jgi:hypothetical protein